MNKCKVSLLKLAAAIPLIATAIPLFGQSYFAENFDNAQAASGRFTVAGNATFQDGVMTVSPGTVVRSSGANPIADTGEVPIVYSYTQSFAPGSFIFPDYASATFRVRSDAQSVNDGYFISILRTGLDASLSVDRVTDAERGQGIIATSIVGGSMFAPPALRTIGPYDLDVVIFNASDLVKLEVYVNDVLAVTVHDTSPYRLTHGDYFAFSVDATHATMWDNISVTAVPEPQTFALFVLGFGVLLIRRVARATPAVR